MRPALHRLLLRPYSQELLRYLTSTYLESTSATITKKRCPSECRKYHQAHHVRQAAAFCNAADEYTTTSSQTSPNPKPGKQTTGEEFPSRNMPRSHIGKRYSLWRSSFAELQFESALDQPNTTGRIRLVDQKWYRNDFNIWAQLLAHRQRIDKIGGIRVIWNRMKDENFQIPSNGRLGDMFWNAFIDLGLEDWRVLEEVVSYAARNCKGWQEFPMLYTRIIQHFALEGNVSEVRNWHERLISKHPPPPARLKAMIGIILNAKGEMGILQYIYENNKHHKFYSRVVPVLCAQGRFEEARQWHCIMISYHDLPANEETVTPLQKYLECYFPKKAVEFKQSLKDVGVEFVSGQSTRLDLTRETMNRVHGVHYGIKEKQYNDTLGARWFATTWVSLDTAINTVQSLGFREIGPLSLQAIALREPVASQITERIEQLENLEISLGKSKYCQAVKDFAKRNAHTLLRSLLESDLHPDSFEDWRLQESLLIKYAADGEWIQYARTRAICLLGGRSAKTIEFNEFLCNQLDQPRTDLDSIMKIVDQMRTRGLPVKSGTSRLMIQKLLRPRQRAHRPSLYLSWNSKDLNIVISMLQLFLKTGSWIPEVFWAEIFTRLGMAGRFADLKALCLFLADWYHPRSTSRREDVLAQCRQSPDLRYFEIASELDCNHPKHPFSLLFSSTFQNSVVEWGFINYFRKFVIPLTPRTTSSADGPDDSKNPDFSNTRSLTAFTSYSAAPKPDSKALGKHPITQGIRLLHRLRKKGVSISTSTVRNAVINRLVEYYAHGNSNKLYNRIARKVNPFTFAHLVQEIEAAWNKEGRKKTLFPEVGLAELKKRIYGLGVSRSLKVGRRRARAVSRRQAIKSERLGGWDQV